MNLGELDLRWIMYDILAVEYSSTTARATITVGAPGGGKRTSIVSQDALFFKVSNWVGEMEAPTVADVFFGEWSGKVAFEKLKDAGWDLRDPLLPETIYQCHIEGGIVLDLFSRHPFSIEEIY